MPKEIAQCYHIISVYSLHKKQTFRQPIIQLHYGQTNSQNKFIQIFIYVASNTGGEFFLYLQFSMVTLSS